MPYIGLITSVDKSPVNYNTSRSIPRKDTSVMSPKTQQSPPVRYNAILNIKKKL